MELLFGSFTFLVLLALLSWALPRARQTVWLVAGFSLIFYSALSFWFLLLLLGTTFVDYVSARVIEANRRRALIALVLSLAANFGVLAFFKYAGFIAQILNDVAHGFGVQMGFVGHDLPLPIGISFYTFQSVAYVVDVYRGAIRPIRRYDTYLLYVSFFPQILAGPIERASHLYPQLESLSPRRFDWGSAMPLLVRGFVKKFLIADNIAPYVDTIFSSPADASVATLVIGTACFGVQIFCDFSGYTDIARGLARGMGITLVPNFDRPYASTSISEFWRRWHMSLSQWLRDYVYIPLGGSRGGLLATCRNLLVTMTLAGIWHGASYNFLIWGGLHGIAMCVERIKNRYLPQLLLPATVCWAMTMTVVFSGWYVFRASRLSDLLVPVEKLLVADSGRNMIPTGGVVAALAIAILGSVYEAWISGRVKIGIWPEAAIAGLLAYAFMPSAYQTFIYFQF